MAADGLIERLLQREVLAWAVSSWMFYREEGGVGSPGESVKQNSGIRAPVPSENPQRTALPVASSSQAPRHPPHPTPKAGPSGPPSLGGAECLSVPAVLVTVIATLQKPMK